MNQILAFNRNMLVVDDLTNYRSLFRWSATVRQKKPNTLRNYRQMLGVFVDFCASRKVTALAGLSAGLMRAFQQYYFDNYPFHGKKNQGRNSDGKATWEKYRQAVSAFCTWATLHFPNEIENNIANASDLKMKSQEKAPRYLTHKEIKLILQYIDRTENGAP